MTLEHRQRLDAALAEHNGNFEKTAVALGMVRRRLYNMCFNDKQLRAHWIKERNPESSVLKMDTIERPQLPISVERETNEELETAAKLATDEEFGASIQDINAAGIKPRDLAVALSNHHRRFYARSMDMLGGGTEKLFLETLQAILDINEELNRAQSLDREAVLRRDRVQLLHANQSIFSNAQKAALIQAMIQQKRKEKYNDKIKHPKGFLAIPIQAQEGSRVDVTIKGNGHNRTERDS